MRRRTRSHLVLLALAALCAAAVFAQILHERSLAPAALTTLDTRAVRELAVSCNNCAPRQFERRRDGWWMRTPYALPADEAAIARLLAIATTPVRSQRAATELDASRLGLQPPQALLQFDQVAVGVGTTDAIDGLRYVAVGERIALVQDRFTPYLRAAAESELDAALVPRGPQLLTLTLDGTPRPDLMEHWRAARAAQIVKPGALAAARGAAVHVELGLADGTTVAYRVDRHGAHIVALRQNPALAYVLDGDAVHALLGDSAAP